MQLTARVDGQEVPALLGLKPYYLGGIRAEGRAGCLAFTSDACTMQEFLDVDVLLLRLAGK